MIGYRPGRVPGDVRRGVEIMTHGGIKATIVGFVNAGTWFDAFTGLSQTDCVPLREGHFYVRDVSITTDTTGEEA